MADIYDVEARLAIERNTFEVQLSSLQSKLNQSNFIKQGLEGALSSAQNEISDLKEQVASLTSRLKEANDSSSYHAGLRRSSEQKFSSLQQKYNDLLSSASAKPLTPTSSSICHSCIDLRGRLAELKETHKNVTVMLESESKKRSIAEENSRVLHSQILELQTELKKQSKSQQISREDDVIMSSTPTPSCTSTTDDFVSSPNTSELMLNLSTAQKETKVWIKKYRDLAQKYNELGQKSDETFNKMIKEKEDIINHAESTTRQLNSTINQLNDRLSKSLIELNREKQEVEATYRNKISDLERQSFQKSKMIEDLKREILGIKFDYSESCGEVENLKQNIQELTEKYKNTLLEASMLVKSFHSENARLLQNFDLLSKEKNLLVEKIASLS
ncbi:hypothetical protein RCL1_002909 [Eukaryota sp. TZLM3-RCL]